MKKAIIIILTALLVLSAFVSCNDNSIIDDEFTRTVTFEKNNEGATGKMAPQTMVTRTATALDANKFELTDNMFIGWNTKADGSGTSYKDKQEISITEDMTLYAQWTHEIETVTFYANDGTETKVTQDVPKNYATNLKENEFTLDNNHFTGWNTKADGTGTPYADKAEVTLTADLTLYAQWIAKVTFDANLGSGTMDPLEVATNSGITLPENKFDAPSDKMEFGSWNTKKDGSGTSYDDEDSITAVTGDITLYAQWNNKTVTITYKGNGGSYVEEETTYTQYTQDVDYNKKATILENKFEKGGYEFLTWNTKKDGTGTEYKVGVETADPLTEDFTLYAIWEKLPISYIDSETTVLKGGETYTIASNVENNNRLIIEGSSPVTIILPETLTLTANKGITVSKNNSLTISGTGTLVAALDPHESYNNYKAAIGGDNSNNDCGNVTITGGTVTATGGPQAAGIGGGGSGGHGGTVTISGGTVYATGGTCSAGIGGGGPSTAGGHGGTVTISGGTVYATGGSGSAGIGGGGFGSEGGNGGTVTISGGTVTATGKDGAAGIGGGEGDFKGGDGADVEISGGSVTATGGSKGLGIGGGSSQYEVGDNKTLKIGSGVHVYETGKTTAYANGPQDNVTTRYQNMTVIKP